MAKAAFKFKIKYDVFDWLIRDSGWTTKEVAEKLGYPERTISNWETGRKDIEIPINKIENLAESFRRPLAAFFLLNPPPKLSDPRDFRKLPRNEIKPYSKETHLAIRKARRLQSISATLLESLHHQKDEIIEIYDYRVHSSENTALTERQRAGITERNQILWADEKIAFNFWRSWIESKNIMVFLIKMSMKDARGFSFSDLKPYIIVLNSSDSTNGRIFSLFHEYGHILLRESVVCNIESYSSDDLEVRQIEKWCNNFAGAFILPEKEISSNSSINNLLDTNNISDCVKNISKSYKISEFGALIRLKNLNRIGDPEFEKEKERIEIETEANLKLKREKEAEKERKGGPSLESTCYKEKGDRFISLVLEGSDKGILSESNVLDYLDIKEKNLEKIRGS